MRILFALVIAMAFGCASRKFEKDYKVVDASAQDIPSWIQDIKEWAEKNEGDDYKKHRYYVFTTEAKNAQGLACKMAKVEVANEIASEISQFINNTYAQALSGDPTSKDTKLVEYVEDNLGKEVKQNVIGASVHALYWEKRKFQKELGASDDWDGYVCSAMMKISKDSLANAFKRAETKLVQKADNDAKAKVKEIIKDTKEAFEKAQ